MNYNKYVDHNTFASLFQQHLKHHDNIASCVIIDPDDMLSSAEKLKFQQLNSEFYEVFGKNLSENSGSFGYFKASTTMSPTQWPQL